MKTSVHPLCPHVCTHLLCDAEPAVRLVIYRKHKDASQAVRLYKELVQGEAKRRNWQDIIEILQVCTRSLACYTELYDII